MSINYKQVLPMILESQIRLLHYSLIKSITTSNLRFLHFKITLSKLLKSYLPLEVFESLDGNEHTNFAGYIVREYSPDEMVELLDILRFLINSLISKAIPRYSPITYYQLESLTEELVRTTEVDQRIRLMMHFNEVAYAPAGMDYSFSLTMQIYRRNIRFFQELLKETYTKDLPVNFRRDFIVACQIQGHDAGIKIWMDEYDSLSKGLIKVLSKTNLPKRLKKR